MARCSTQTLYSEPIAGRFSATEDLFATMYSELHGIAERALRRTGIEIGIGPSTLVHETYLRVTNCSSALFPDVPHFLGYTSRAMRGLIIDHLRRRHANKRGDGVEVTLSNDVSNSAEAEQTSYNLEQLTDAMQELAVMEPMLSELVHLHFFCGYSFVEIAALRSVSERTVQRDWRKARLLLYRAVAPAGV
ncbi:MAG: ECF-type sigma factor [Gemmatimonadaceae bacterium]